ncbi:MAG: hypothetical protein CYPHOPRED_004009 [Cyphobasidiales sp. Tagirdzhanova-0007]|nr:MAG: hypothetical protein CYPHOPRED_004009 [Cyphobasidiales sp. Tagirdzhanova-0007]
MVWGVTLDELCGGNLAQTPNPFLSTLLAASDCEPHSIVVQTASWYPGQIPELRHIPLMVAALGKGRPGDEKRLRGQGPMSKYTRAPTSAPKASADVRCQRCLKLGHYTYDCTNDPAYKIQRSRSARLAKPKQGNDRPSVAVPIEFGGSGQAVTSSVPLPLTSGLATKILSDKEKARKRKRARSQSVDSSGSESSSDTSSSSDSSDSDSDDSSESSSSQSHSAGSKKRRRRRSTPSKSRSRSRSPPSRTHRRSASLDLIATRRRRIEKSSHAR